MLESKNFKLSKVFEFFHMASLTLLMNEQITFVRFIPEELKCHVYFSEVLQKNVWKAYTFSCNRENHILFLILDISWQAKYSKSYNLNVDEIDYFLRHSFRAVRRISSQCVPGKKAMITTMYGVSSHQRVARADRLLKIKYST